MNENYKKTATEFSQIPSSTFFIKKAFLEIKPQKGENIWWIISIILSIIISVKICFSYNTVILTGKMLNTFMALQLALFGVVLTVYSIILAFFSDNLLKTLSEIKIKNKSSLKVYISYYEKILFLYFFSIAATLIGTIMVNLTDENFILINKQISDIFAFGLSLIYYAFSIRVFFEIKSMIYNTISLFRVNISYKFLGFFTQNDDDNNK